MMKIYISESLLSLNVQALLYLVFVGVLIIFVRKSLMGTQGSRDCRRQIFLSPETGTSRDVGMP